MCRCAVGWWCVQVCSGVVVCGGSGLCVFGGGVFRRAVGWWCVAGLVCVCLVVACVVG